MGASLSSMRHRVQDGTSAGTKTSTSTPLLRSEASATSTYTYSQEPFKTWHNKVIQLCMHHFRDRHLEVERMKGGSINRVVAISVGPETIFKGVLGRACSKLLFWALQCLTKGNINLEKYIVRVPRWDDDEGSGSVVSETCTTKFIGTQTQIPVPEIIHVSNSSQNILQSRYMIQKRLPGENLESLWPKLTQAQRCNALRRMVNIAKQLQNMKSNRAGFIHPSHDGSAPQTISAHDELMIDKFDVLNLDWPSPTPPSTPQTTFEFMMEMWEIAEKRWKLCHKCVDPAMYKMRKIILALRNLGFFPDDHDSLPFAYVHTDLFPRNILAEIVDDATIKITGVLDWDPTYTYFGPKFIVYRAPFYFWHEVSESITSNERHDALALAEPITKNGKELKELFLSLVSPEWQYYAFTFEYVTARRIMKYLLLDSWASHEMHDADDAVRCWRERYGDDAKLSDNYLDTGIDQGFWKKGSPERNAELNAAIVDAETDASGNNGVASGQDDKDHPPAIAINGSSERDQAS